MEAIEIKRPVRQRQVVYLRPAVIRQLKREKGETDKSMGEIIEEALARRRKPGPHAANAAP